MKVRLRGLLDQGFWQPAEAGLAPLGAVSTARRQSFVSQSAGKVDMKIDLGAERLIAAERGGEKIAVEIKSLTNPSSAATRNSKFKIQNSKFKPKADKPSQHSE